MMKENEKKAEKRLPSTPHLKREFLMGLIIVLCFFGVFGGWALISPLESASITQGKVVVAGYRRLIQHYEGGIVKDIFVKDGSLVEKGQKLIQLDNTQAKVALDLVVNQYIELNLTVARLRAELRLDPTFEFPVALSKYKNHPEVYKIFDSQKKIFQADERDFFSRIDILIKKIDQLNEQKKGEKSQLKSFLSQQELIKTELKEVKILYNKRLIERSKLLSLMREDARLAGMSGEKIAKIASLEQAIGETNREIISMKTNRRKELLDELREAQSKLRETSEREKSAKHVMNRTTVRSPQTGTVVGLTVNTLGRVIKPGETLMEIVPKHERLVVETEINLQDIDVVHPGLSAKVQLSAFQSRTTPALLGKVSYVSADTFQNEKTGVYYYKATIEINPNELKKLGKQTLYPGMPAEVMIITKRLTPFQYFFEPIQRSFNRAFREE